MNFDELKARDVKDLRLLAAQYGIKTHHKAKAETIAKQIVEHVANPQKPPELKHEAQKPKAPTVINTEEDVSKIIEPFLKKEGFSATFPGDGTWIFKYKGAEDAGHLSVPLRIIRNKAEMVSHGARKPVMINLGDGPLLTVG